MFSILFRFIETTFVGQHIFEGLCAFTVSAADTTWRAYNRLIGEGFHHFIGGDVVGTHTVGLKPTRMAYWRLPWIRA